MGREPTFEETTKAQAVSERELTAKPTLTDADRDKAEGRVGVDDGDHLAAGKADATDHGTSGGEVEAEKMRGRSREAGERSS